MDSRAALETAVESPRLKPLLFDGGNGKLKLASTPLLSRRRIDGYMTNSRSPARVTERKTRATAGDVIQKVEE